MGTPTRRARPPLAIFVATALVATLLVFDLPSATSTDTASAAPAPGQIDTFAGTGVYGNTGDGGAATDAQVGDPGGLAVDTRTGDVYVSLPAFHVIRKIDPSGRITTIAGTSGSWGYRGDGADATTALLAGPQQLAIGPDGALYVADQGNFAIRRIDLDTNVITTAIGFSNPLRELTHEGHPSEGVVRQPNGITVAPAPEGSVRLAVSSHTDNWIRLVDLGAGTVATIAGTGTGGFSGDRGPAIAAQLSGPRGLAYDTRGSLLIVDRSNHRVRRVDAATGSIDTILGDGRSGWEDGDGWPAAEAFASFPEDVIVGDDGSWYLSNSVTLKRITPDGIAGTIAGLGPTQGDGGPSVLSQIRPGALAFLPDGRLLVAEASFNHRIRVIVPGEPPPAPVGVSATVLDDRSLRVDVNPAVGLARLHEVTIELQLAGRRSIDEPRDFYSLMPRAVLLDPSMVRSTTFTDIEAGAVTQVSVRAHNGWGYGPARTFDLVVQPDPDPDGTCRWATGSDGSWHDPTRWSCGGEQRVPTIEDDVVVDVEPGGLFFTVTMASDAEARSLRIGRPADARTEQHRLAMVDGVHPNARVLTLAEGPLEIARTGRLDAGRSGVPPGCCSQSGWIARIEGVDGAAVELVNHGAIEAHNLRLTGDLMAGRPADDPDGPGGRITSRGENSVTGTFDLEPGGSLFLVVDRGEEPFAFGSPPRWTISGGDLTVHEGASLTLWIATNDLGINDGQVAIATPTGAVVNHGRIRGWGHYPSTSNVRSRIEGPFHNHGEVRIESYGIQLGGPNGTVHTNTGTFVIGDRSAEFFTTNGGPVTVVSGRTLVNSGSIEIDRTRRLHGTVVNDGGTITRTSLVSVDDTVDLGLDGPQPVVGTSHDGASLPVTITWYGSAHPYTSADERVDASTDWWAIDVDPGLSAISLTLPRSTDRDDPVSCRHLPGDDANPTLGWDCLDPDEITTTTLTVDRNGAIPDGLPAGRSEWTVGGTPPVADPDPDPDPEPFAFELFDVDETGPDLLNAVLLGQLAAAVYRWACGAETCEKGVAGDPDDNTLTNDDWIDGLATVADDWRFSDLRAHHDPDVFVEVGGVMAPISTGADAMSLRIDDAFVIAFRGTEGTGFDGIFDWNTNRKFTLLPALLPDLGLVGVHRGFWDAVDAIYDDLVDHLDEHPDVPVWITGHSLGGAMATLAAVRLHADGYDVGGVHTFGAPLVGDHLFEAAYASSGLGARTHRWAADRDIVTLLLVSLDAYGRVGRDHVLYRTDEDDELAFDLVLDDALALRPAGINDHDVTRYVRRLHSLLPTDITDALPTPYGPPDPDGDLDELIEFAIAVGLDPALLVHLLLELLTDVTDLAIEAIIKRLIIAGATIEYLLAVVAEMFEATLQEVVAVVVAVLDALGTLPERIRELFLALEEVYGTTVEQLIEWLEGLDLDPAVLAELIAILLSDAVDRLLEALDTLFLRLADWLEAFGIDPDLLPPLVPSDLAALIDTEALLGVIAEQVRAPLIALRDAGERGLDTLLTELATIEGVVVHHAEAAGFPIPPTPGDLLELEWRIPVGAVLDDLDALEAELSKRLDGFLDGVATQIDDLDEVIGELLADLEVVMVVGLDAEGAYLAAGTQIGLSVSTGASAGIEVGATVDGLGEFGASAAAQVQFDVSLTVAPAITGRIRLDDAGALDELGAGVSLSIGADSSAATTVELEIEPIALTWTASGQFDPPGFDTGLEAELTMPGFLTGDGSAVRVSLIGIRAGGTWVLSGGLADQTSSIGPLTLASLDVGPLTVAPGIFTGQGNAQVSVDVGGVSSVEGGLALSVNGNALQIGGTIDLPDPFEIEIAGTALARIDGGTLDATYRAPTAGVPTVELRVAADALVVLPDVGADGAVTVDGLDAELAADGSFELTIDRVDLDLTGGLLASMNTVTIALTADEQRPVLTAASATLDLPGFGLAGSVTDLRISRSGEITAAAANVCLDDLDGLLSDLAGFLPFTIDSVCLDFEPADDGRARLDRFRLTATGALDLSLLEGALGDDVNIEVRLGDQIITDPDDPVQIEIEVLSVDPLAVVAAGADSITIVISGLGVGPLTFGAEITVAADGGVTTVDGSVTVAGLDLDETSPLVGSVTGSVADGTAAFTLAVTAEGPLTFGAVDVTDLSLELDLAGTADDGLTVGAFAGAATFATSLGEGPGAVDLTVPLALEWTGTAFTITGSTSVDGTIAVGFGGPTVLTITDPTFEASLTVDGGAPTIEIDLTAASFELFPDLDLIDITGTGVSGRLGPDGTVTLGADALDATLADTFALDVSDLGITVGPGPDDAVVLSAATVSGQLVGLGAGITVTDLVIRRDGTVTVAEVALSPGAIADRIGIAGLFPFTIDPVDGVVLTFPVPGDLKSFAVTVRGEFDLERLDEWGESLGFTPVLVIGERTLGGDSPDDGRFEFTVEIDANADIPVRPTDIGPITLGFDDLTVGPLTFGATITFGGLDAGQPVPTISGTVRIAGGIEADDSDGLDAEGSLEVSLSGEMSIVGGETEVNLAAQLTVSGSMGDFLTVENLAIDAAMSLTFDGESLGLTPPTLGDITYDLLEIGVTDLVTFTARNGAIDLGASEGELLAQFGPRGLEILFGDGAGPLEGFGGDVGNVGLLMTAVNVAGVDGLVPVPVLLPGFTADVSLPPDADLGFPDWVPLNIRSIGFSLPDDVGLDLDDLETNPDAVLVEFTTELLAGLRIRLSGGIEPNGVIPIRAELEGLELSIERLVDCALSVVDPDDGLTAPVCENPIIDLAGISGGVEPFELGPITIGGVLGVGLVPVALDDTTEPPIENVFVFRIAGQFTYSGIGAGIDLVMSEYGPVLAEVTVPLAIPLAQTTLLLTGVKGGIQFGGDGFTPPDDPNELVDSGDYDISFPMDFNPTGAIARALRRCANENQGYSWSQFPDVLPDCFTWNDGGTAFLGATLTSYAVPGLISGDLTLAVDLRFDQDGGLPNLRFAGRGDINVFGFPIGTAGMLLAFDDPLAPQFDLAFKAPGGQGNPLGFLLPAQGNVAMRIDTTGITLGSLLATQAFLQALADGTVELGGQLFDDAFDQLAARLDEQRSLLLTQQLLDHPDIDADTVITSDFLLDRLLGRNGVPGLLPTTIPTDRDELTALVIEVSDVLSAIQEALFSQIADLADQAGSVADLGFDLDDLATLVADPLYALNLANELIDPEQAAALAAYGQFAQEVFQRAFTDAGAAFSEEFDPLLVVTGQLQPMLLGVPMGEPTEQITFAVSRSSAVLSARTSPSTMFLTVFNAATAVIGQLNAQFGLSETLEIGAQLPLDDLVDTLFMAGPLAIDPFSPEWSVTVEAGVRLAGLEIASLSGYVFSPDDETLLCTRVHKVWETGPAECNDEGVPVTSPEHYAKLLEHGGILVSGRLDAPDLLIDPVATITAVLDLVGEPPESILDYPAWIGDIAAVATGVQRAGQFQLFVPGFTNLIDPSYEGNIWTVDYVGGDDADRFNFNVPAAQLEQRLLDVIADAYVDAVWDVRLLGIDLARGYLTASPTGYQVSAEVPFLDDPVTFQLGGSTVSVGGDESFWPSALLDVELDESDIAALLASVGAPTVLVVPGRAAGRFRMATPGYDLDSDDLLLVRGGVSAQVLLDLPPFVSGQEFDITLFPPAGASSPFEPNSILPDLVATARVGSIGPLAGITITDASVELRRLDGDTTVRIVGTASVAGASVSVDAQLADDLTGTIDLSGGGGPLLVGGFTISGGARLELARTTPTGPLTITLRSDLLVTLPTWLSALVGTTTIAAEGSVSSDGSFDLTLLADQLGLPGTGLRIIGPQSGTPVNLRFARPAGGAAVITIGGRLADAGRLPLLAVGGELSTTGEGQLQVAFPGGGLDLGGFSIAGGASIVRTGSNWSVNVEGALSVAPLFDNATVSGSMSNTGIDELVIGVDSFNAGPLSIENALLTLQQVDRGYVLSVEGDVTIPNMGAKTGFTGTIGSKGDLDIALTTSSRSIHGLQVSGAEFDLSHRPGTNTTRVTIDGSATLAGQTAAIDGTLTRTGNRWTGELTVQLPSLSIGGVNIQGSFAVLFTDSNVRLSVDGSLEIPGLATTNVTGTLTTGGFTVNADGLQLTVAQLRPPNSPFRFDGTFRFVRTASHTRFESVNAGLTWETGGSTFTLPTFRVATDGSMDVSTAARSITKGRIQLTLPAATFSTGPSATNPMLTVGPSSVSITGLFGPVALDGFTVGSNGNLTATLGVPAVSIGGLSLKGQIELRKVGTTWSVHVDGPSSDPAELTVPGLPDPILLRTFTISSNSSFDVEARSRRLGGQLLWLSNASIRFRKTANGEVRIAVGGGATLNAPPLGPLLDIPAFEMSTSGAILGTAGQFSRVLEFGPMLRRASTVPLEIRNGANGFELRLRSARDFTLFGSTIRLHELSVRADGTFEGRFRNSIGLPTIPSITLATGDFAVSRHGGVVRLTIPASNPRNVGTGLFSTTPIGTASATVHGWIASTGAFSLTLNASVDLTMPLVGSGVKGSATGTIDHTGASGTVTAELCVINIAGFEACQQGARTIKSSGMISMPFPAPDFPILRSFIEPIDTTPPYLGPIEDVEAVVPFGTPSAQVYYPLPVAVDDRDSSPTVTCSPASGALFPIGVTTVGCWAVDSTGNANGSANAPARTFTVTVMTAEPLMYFFESSSLSYDLGAPPDDGSTESSRTPVVAKDEQVTIRLAGYGPNEPVDFRAFSEPIFLGRVRADSNGVATFRFTVPDLPTGPHTLVATGRGADGRLVVVTIPIFVIGGSPSVDDRLGNVPATWPGTARPERLPVTGHGGAVTPPVAPTVTPTLELPATGARGTPETVSLAALILLVGLAIRLGGLGSRRRLRCDGHGRASRADRGARTVDADRQRPPGVHRFRQGARPARLPRPGR